MQKFSYSILVFHKTKVIKNFPKQSQANEKMKLNITKYQQKNKTKNSNQ